MAGIGKGRGSKSTSNSNSMKSRISEARDRGLGKSGGAAGKKQSGQGAKNGASKNYGGAKPRRVGSDYTLTEKAENFGSRKAGKTRQELKAEREELIKKRGEKKRESENVDRSRGLRRRPGGKSLEELREKYGDKLGKGPNSKINPRKRATPTRDREDLNLSERERVGPKRSRPGEKRPSGRGEGKLGPKRGDTGRTPIGVTGVYRGPDDKNYIYGPGKKRSGNGGPKRGGGGPKRGAGPKGGGGRRPPGATGGNVGPGGKGPNYTGDFPEYF